MTQGKFFFNSKQTDCLQHGRLASTRLFPENVYSSSGVVLPELWVTQDKGQFPGHELRLLTFGSQEALTFL